MVFFSRVYGGGMEPDKINLRDLALPNIVEKKILAMPSEQESKVSARSSSKIKTSYHESNANCPLQTSGAAIQALPHRS